MDNLIFILYICLAIPLLLTLGILDKKARTVMGFLVIGMTLCMYVAQINGLMLQLAGGDTFYVTTSLTPISEEIIKALPILFYAFVISDDRQKLLTNAMAVGIGFAILENAYLAMSADDITFTWALVRAFGAGLMHGICTSAVGLGLSFARQKKKLFVPGTFALLTAAITYHAIYNLLVQSEHIAYFGFLLPVITYIPFIVFQARNVKKQRLAAAKAAELTAEEGKAETSGADDASESTDDTVTWAEPVIGKTLEDIGEEAPDAEASEAEAPNAEALNVEASSAEVSEIEAHIPEDDNA